MNKYSVLYVTLVRSQC